MTIPTAELNRLTSFFRLIVIIPIAVILCLVNGAVWESGEGHQWAVTLSAGGVAIPGHHAHAGLQTEVPALVV